MDDVAVTGLLITAEGSAFRMVATQLLMAGSFHQILAGGCGPAVSTSLRMELGPPGTSRG